MQFVGRTATGENSSNLLGVGKEERCCLHGGVSNRDVELGARGHDLLEEAHPADGNHRRYTIAIVRLGSPEQHRHTSHVTRHTSRHPSHDAFVGPYP